MLHHHLHPQHLRGFAKLFNSGKFSYENILKSWHCTFLSNDITLNTLKLFILPELGLQPFRECKKSHKAFGEHEFVKLCDKNAVFVICSNFETKHCFFHDQALTGTRYPTRPGLFFPYPNRTRKIFQNFRVQGSSYIYAIISPGFLAPCSMLHAQDGKTSTKDYEKLLDLPRPFSEIYKW